MAQAFTCGVLTKLGRKEHFTGAGAACRAAFGALRGARVGTAGIGKAATESFQ